MGTAIGFGSNIRREVFAPPKLAGGVWDANCELSARRSGEKFGSL